MTEYEMLSTSQGNFALALTILGIFMTLISAYLVAGYLASHRISLSMAVFVSVLFVIFTAGLIDGVTSARNFNLALTDEMRSYADAGKGLTWMPGYTRRSFVGQISDYTIIIVLILSVVGSVYFFFQCRRVNRIAEAGVSHAKT